MGSDYAPPLLIGPCRICTWRALTQGGLCHDCREIHEASLVSRALCGLIHRGEVPPRPQESLECE